LKVLIKKTTSIFLNLSKNSAIVKSDYEEIKVPVLISVGDKDVMVNVEESVLCYAQYHSSYR
jgi:esterase/lipase